MRAAMLAAVVAAGGAVALAADAAPTRVERLVDRLGSGGFREREAATRELDTLGEAALDSLRRAAASGEPEVRRRAADLVARISDRLATIRILSATLVDFNYKDKPIAEAINDLNRRMGATFTVHNLGPNKFHEWDGLTPIDGMVDHQAATAQLQGLGGFQGQIIINGRIRSPRPAGPAPNAMIILDGPGAAMPTHRGGAARIRVLPPATTLPNAAHAADEVVLALQVSAEPKLIWQGVADVRVDRAIDEAGRSLPASGVFGEVSADENQMMFINQFGMVVQSPNRRMGSVGVRIRRGDPPAKRLAELAGVVAAQVRLAEPMVLVPTPLKAVGQPIRGERGVSLVIKSATKAANGDVVIKAEVQMPIDVQLPQAPGAGNGMMMGGAIQIQGNVAIRQMVIGPGNVLMQNQNSPPSAGATEYLGLSVEDANGKRFNIAHGHAEPSAGRPDGWTLPVTVTFHPTEKDVEAARLVFTATRPATIDIPFAVKDVPLP